MSFDSSALGPDRLREAERTYRKRLLEEPANAELRLQLARCLLLLTFHQAGRESVLLELRALSHIASPDLGALADSLLAPESGILLDECLRQLSVVTHLNAPTQERLGAEELQELVRLSGAEAALSAVEAKAVEGLAELLRDLDAAETAPPRRPRRRPARGR
jgi:hypothetical protein